MIKNLKINEDAFLKLQKRKKILEEGKGYFTGYPSIDMPWLKYYTEEQILCPTPSLSAYDYIKILNINNLNKTAINYKGSRISYKELFQNVENTAKFLKRLGVKKGEKVTALMPPSPEEIYLLYALDKIGAAVNFVIFGTPMEKVYKTMKELNSTKIFIADCFEYNVEQILSEGITDIIEVPFSLNANSFKKGNKKGNNIKKWNELLEESKNDLAVSDFRNIEDTLFIAKTGGTTGEPKCVEINDQSFNNVSHQYLNSSLDYNVGDKWLRLWPIFHATSAISGNHLPLCAGMEILLAPEFNFTNIDEIIWNYKPNHLLLVPPLLEIIINSPLLQNKDLSFVKTVGCGGAGMTSELEKKAIEFFKVHNADVYLGCGYGLTENSSVATIRMNEETTTQGGVGVPLVDTIVSVFDVETGNELKYNQEGEICIKSSNFMKGYYKDEESTKKVIRSHKDGSKWIHTGDLGYIDENGQVYIKGRIMRTIFLHSAEKVYPNDLEDRLSIVEGVKEIAVISIPDKEHEGFFVPACCIVPESSISPDEIINNINLFCQNNVEAYAIPRNIYFVSKIPVTKMGKPDIKQLELKYSL